MADDLRKTELINQLARARQDITVGLHGVERGMQFGQRAKAAFAQHSLAWVAGASLLGFVLAKLPARTKKVVVDRKGRADVQRETVVKAGLFVTLLKLAFDAARPALTKWLMQRVTTYAQQRYGAPRN